MRQIAHCACKPLAVAGSYLQWAERTDASANSFCCQFTPEGAAQGAQCVLYVFWALRCVYSFSYSLGKCWSRHRYLAPKRGAGKIHVDRKILDFKGVSVSRHNAASRGHTGAFAP